MSEEFITVKEAAKVLKCSESKLNVGRSRGTLSIPYFKNGEQVLYKKSDLILWLESRRYHSTSEYQTAPGWGRGHKKDETL